MLDDRQRTQTFRQRGSLRLLELVGQDYHGILRPQVAASVQPTKQIARVRKHPAFAMGIMHDRDTVERGNDDDAAVRSAVPINRSSGARVNGIPFELAAYHPG